MAFKVEIERGESKDTVFFDGSLTEMASDEIEKLKQVGLSDTVVFNFRGIERVNSSGVHLWLRFLNDFQKGRDITYAECSNEIVHQMNMVPSFSGNAKIESFYASLRCSVCDESQRSLCVNDRQVEEILDSLEQSRCDSCGAEMEIEEDPTTYFRPPA